MFENAAVTMAITANAVKKKCLVFMFVPFLVGLVFLVRKEEALAGVKANHQRNCTNIFSYLTEKFRKGF